MQLNYTKCFGGGNLPLEKRLEMKRAEAKLRQAAERARQRKRSLQGGDLRNWKLRQQAGCWFWFNDITGESTFFPLILYSHYTLAGESASGRQRLVTLLALAWCTRLG